MRLKKNKTQVPLKKKEKKERGYENIASYIRREPRLVFGNDNDNNNILLSHLVFYSIVEDTTLPSESLMPHGNTPVDMVSINAIAEVLELLKTITKSKTHMKVPA
jgi:hypothetical protein